MSGRTFSLRKNQKIRYGRGHSFNLVIKINNEFNTEYVVFDSQEL